jgi:hypothetical protein
MGALTVRAAIPSYGLRSRNRLDASVSRRGSQTTRTDEGRRLSGADQALASPGLKGSALSLPSHCGLALDKSRGPALAASSPAALPLTGGAGPRKRLRG